MIPAAFDYVRAGSAEEAISLIGQHGDEAKFLAGGHSLLPMMKLRLARPDGGRVGLVLPVSLLTARDAGPIRASVLRQASIKWFWSSPEHVFDAMVRTCAVGFERAVDAVTAASRQLLAELANGLEGSGVDRGSGPWSACQG